MINVSVFGPVHSGKSSLMGYVRASLMTEYERNNTWLSIKRKLAAQNIDFNISDKYTYFVSTDAEDLKRNPLFDSIGSTKKISIKNMGSLAVDLFESDTNFIDNPGLNPQKSWKDRYRGIFMGDIGIFVIDISQVLRLRDLDEGSAEYIDLVRNQFSSLYYWRSIKPQQELIIVLAKCDVVRFEIDILSAIDEIHSFYQFSQIPVIPTGIYFDTEDNFNITNKGKTPTEFMIDTFTDALKKSIQRSGIYPKNRQLSFGMVERTFRAPHTSESVLRIKMLEGMITKGEEVILAPVRRGSKQPYGKASCIVKSLKLQDREFVDQFYSGDIGGVAFSRVTFENSVVSLSDIEISPSTCIVGKETSYSMGALICFKTTINTDPLFLQYFERLNIHSEIEMIWLGRVISAKLISRYTEDTICHFSVVSPHHLLVVPKDENGKYSIKQFALVVDNNYFFQAELEHVGEISEERFNIVSNGKFSLYIFMDLTETSITYEKEEIEYQLKIKSTHVRSEFKEGSYTAWIDLNKRQYDLIAKSFNSFVKRNKVKRQVFCPINIE